MTTHLSWSQDTWSACDRFALQRRDRPIPLLPPQRHRLPRGDHIVQREDLLECLTLVSCSLVSEYAVLLFRSRMLHAWLWRSVSRNAL